MRRRGTRNALSRQISEGGVMTALLAAVWLLVDYPWGLLAFALLAVLYGLR